VTRTDPTTAATRTTTKQYCERADVDAGTCPFVGLLASIDGPRSDVNDSVTYTYRQADDPACATTPTTCAWRKGDLWKVTNALGQVQEMLAYDGAGRLLRSRDINGVITDREYDARGRLTASKTRGTDDTVETDDRIQRISYWPIGQVRRVTQPDGAYLEYGYDAAQRLVSVQDNLGNRIDYTLNAAGQRTAEQVRDPGNTLRRSLSRSYNSLAQLIQATDADNHSTSFTYDANGNADLTTDALGRVTNANHDPLQRLRQSLQDTAGINANTQFAYDERDNLTRVTDPKGLNTDYSYNGFDELVQLNSPDTGTTTYAYDPAGNRTQQTDARGVVTQYAYDALQRIMLLSYPSDSTRNVTYAYDTAQSDCPIAEAFLAGRLSRMTDASGSTTYCYNRYGDLTRKVQRTNGQLLALRWEYGVDGRVQRMVYPNGAEADYAYDTLGRLVEIGVKPTATAARQVLLNQATYAPFGPVTGWVYGNGLAMRRPVDLDYQPQAVEVLHTDGQGVQTAVGLRLGYIFDAVGNLLRLEDSRSPGTVKRRFGYDGLDRLASMRKADEELLQSYTYDATGNRIAMTELIPVFDGAPGGGGTTTYQTINHTYTYPASSHRLTAVDGVPRSYDAAGNLIQLGDATMPGGPRDFGYDASNRMAQMSRLSQVKASYAYNGAGERVRKTTPGGVETYSLHDPAGRWIGDYEGSGQPIQQAVWFGDLPVGVIATVPASAGQTQQKLFHLQPDMLGTPRVAVDPTRGATGTVVWTWDLEGEAFGSEPAQADPDGDGVAFQLDMRFPGQRLDGTTGLHYNYFRDYEPGSGRYVQSDPIGLEGGLNTYSYVEAAPLTSIDPSGLALVVLPAAGRVIIHQVARCTAMYAAYKGAEKNCRQCKQDCGFEDSAAGCACWALVVQLRKNYLRFKCDYFYPGSIAKGSANQERAHRIELRNKINARNKCCVRAAYAFDEEFL
jgi:RHS repeat-associated protein